MTLNPIDGYATLMKEFATKEEADTYVISHDCMAIRGELVLHDLNGLFGIRGMYYVTEIAPSKVFSLRRKAA